MPSATLLYLPLLVLVLLACLSSALCDTRRTLQSESRVAHVSGGSHSSVSGHGTASSGSVAFSSSFGQGADETTFLDFFFNALSSPDEPETSGEAETLIVAPTQEESDPIETSPDLDRGDIPYTQYSMSRSHVRGHGWSSGHAQTQNTGARSSAGPPYGHAKAFAAITPSGHKRRGKYERGHAHASYYFNPWGHWGK